MKNLKNSPTTSLLFLITSFLMFACQKPDLKEDEAFQASFFNNQPNATVSTSSYALKHFETQEEVDAYAKDKLEVLAKVFARLSVDDVFKNILVNFARNSSDSTGEDSCVIIERLVNHCATVNYDLPTKANEILQDYGTNENFMSLINAFKNFEGENLYPQVYLPIPEELPLYNTIYSVAYWGDEEYNNYKVYFMNSNSIIPDSGYKDTGALQVSHAWVISINEVVDDNAMMPPPTTGDQLDSSFGKRNLEPDKYAMQFLKVKRRKENWISGKCEVFAIRALASTDPAVTSINLNNNNTKGDFVGKISTALLKSGSGIDVYFLWVKKPSWEAFPNRPLLAWVLFERDPLAKRKRAVVPLNYNPYKEIQFWFNSANSHFGASFFTNTSIPYPYGLFHILNYDLSNEWKNGDIVFNNKLY